MEPTEIILRKGGGMSGSDRGGQFDPGISYACMEISQ
jgi:hypothetical protein